MGVGGGASRPSGPAGARSLRCAALLLLLRLPAGEASGRPCPDEELATHKSRDSGGHRIDGIAFVNKAGVDVLASWADAEGLERPVSTIGPGEIHSEDTFPGHTFVFRAEGSRRLLLAFEVSSSTRPGAIVPVEACDGMAQDALEDGRQRWAEFERLARDSGAACVGPRSAWSCVRRVPPEEMAGRDPALYGLREEEVKGSPYEAGETVDTTHDDQVPYIPNMTDYEEGGFLKMEMPASLRDVLLPFYAEHRHRAIKHPNIPGFFTNNHAVPMDLLSLDYSRDVRKVVVRELREVLQWWTKRPLRHTMTFGVRVYRKGSMLINHLDKRQTHLVSAVLQVAQQVPEGGAWPLEVLHPHRPGAQEVYLRPGEMVLYEGARLLHGRPMRFPGEEFANVFTHFAPTDWQGAQGERNPHFDAKPSVGPRATSSEEL